MPTPDGLIVRLGRHDPVEGIDESPNPFVSSRGSKAGIAKAKNRAVFLRETTMPEVYLACRLSRYARDYPGGSLRHSSHGGKPMTEQAGKAGLSILTGDPDPMPRVLNRCPSSARCLTSSGWVKCCDIATQALR